jgi:hypothetical protein
MTIHTNNLSVYWTVGDDETPAGRPCKTKQIESVEGEVVLWEDDPAMTGGARADVHEAVQDVSGIPSSDLTVVAFKVLFRDDGTVLISNVEAVCTPRPIEETMALDPPDPWEDDERPCRAFVDEEEVG